MSVYKATPVEKEVFEANDLGGKFYGGTIVDGLYDKDNDQPLLLVRYEEGALVDWEATYWQLHELVKTVRIGSVIPPAALLQNLGDRDQVIRETVQRDSAQLAQAMFSSGGIGWVETPIEKGPDAGGVLVQTLMLAIPDMHVFNGLPRPEPVPTEVEANGEEQQQEG